MMIFWKIRYLDRADRQFKDRNMVLDTEQLVPEQKAAVELALDLMTTSTEHEFVKFRPLFREKNEDEPTKWALGIGARNHPFSMSDYFEDETGKEISGDEMGQIVTGSPTARLIPRGAQQHDIDFMLSKPEPLPVASVSLAADDVKALGYFRRDLRELSESSFMKDGPGSLKMGGNTTEPVLETAVTDEEIRSFVTIFRRLYMKSEDGHFLKAGSIFTNAVGTNPYGKWVAGSARTYEAILARPVDTRPLVLPGCYFTRKRLLDVFIYTRYAHQPNVCRERQYQSCLKQIGNKKSILMWLFLTELSQCCSQIKCAGKTIVNWFERYCEHHALTPDVVPSVLHDNPGIGAQEKEANRKERLFKEKVEELAIDMWKNQGSPAGGHLQFLAEARTMLSRTMNNDGG